MENRNMKKMAGFAAAVFLGLMLTSCQGTQKAEQSGYKVFCRNAEATALREVQYEPEAEGGEKLVEELLSAMEGTFNRNDYQSGFPEGLTAAVSCRSGADDDADHGCPGSGIYRCR